MGRLIKLVCVLIVVVLTATACQKSLTVGARNGCGVPLEVTATSVSEGDRVWIQVLVDEETEIRGTPENPDFLYLYVRPVSADPFQRFVVPRGVWQGWRIGIEGVNEIMIPLEGEFCPSGVSGVVAADLVDSWADEIVRDSGADGAVVDRVSALCAAEAIVGGLGESAAAMHLAADEAVLGDQNESPGYSRQDATVYASALVGCVDLAAGLFESMVSEGIDVVAAECMVDGYDRAGWMELLTLSGMGENQAVEDLISLDSLLEDCGLAGE